MLIISHRVPKIFKSMQTSQNKNHHADQPSKQGFWSSRSRVRPGFAPLTSVPLIRILLDLRTALPEPHISHIQSRTAWCTSFRRGLLVFSALWPSGFLVLYWPPSAWGREGFWFVCCNEGCNLMIGHVWLISLWGLPFSKGKQKKSGSGGERRWRRWTGRAGAGETAYWDIIYENK